MTAAKSDGQSLIPQNLHGGVREEVLTSWLLTSSHIKVNVIKRGCSEGHRRT